MKLLFKLCFSLVLFPSEMVLIEYQPNKKSKAQKMAKVLTHHAKIPGSFIRMRKLKQNECKKSYKGMLYLCLKDKTFMLKKEKAFKKTLGEFRRL